MLVAATRFLPINRHQDGAQVPCWALGATGSAWSHRTSAGGWRVTEQSWVSLSIFGTDSTPFSETDPRSSLIYGSPVGEGIETWFPSFEDLFLELRLSGIPITFRLWNMSWNEANEEFNVVCKYFWKFISIPWLSIGVLRKLLLYTLWNGRDESEGKLASPRFQELTPEV